MKMSRTVSEIFLALAIRKHRRTDERVCLLKFRDLDDRKCKKGKYISVPTYSDKGKHTYSVTVAESQNYTIFLGGKGAFKKNQFKMVCYKKLFINFLQKISPLKAL